MDKLKFTYTPSGDYSCRRSDKVTLTVPHGDQWYALLDDFIAFLRLTGYSIDEHWIELYHVHKHVGENAEKFTARLSEDAVELAIDYEGDTPPTRRRSRKSTTKKKTKKKKA